MASVLYYDVIDKPMVTEKSMSEMGEKKYTFLVLAFEHLFFQYFTGFRILMFDCNSTF